MGTQFDAEGNPPAYDIPSQDTYLSISASTSIRAVNRFSKPTNFLYIAKDHGDINETYVIDPSLQIPDSYLLSRNSTNGDCVGERKNVYLHTDHGNIDVNLWIVGRKDLPGPIMRTTMHVSSGYGSLAVKVNAIDNIHPFTLEVTSEEQPVTVFIPRSFHGTFTFSMNGGMSSEVWKHGTHLSALNNRARWFIGDFSVVSGSGFGSGLAEWAPDELRIETGYGYVTIKYVDEV